MKKNVKAKIDDKGRVTFLTDEDGVSEKDYLIILTSLIFFGGIGVGLIYSLIGTIFGLELPDKYIELIKVMDIPLGIILGGVFTVKTAQTIVSRRTDGNSENETVLEVNKEDIY